MKFITCSLFAVLLLTTSATLMASSVNDAEKARAKIAASLSEELLCQAGEGIARAGDPDSNRLITSAGAVIVEGNDPFFNQFRYSFKEPLSVGANQLFRVQQDVGEGGVIFIAEVKGGLQALVKQLGAVKASAEDDFIGVENVIFYKTLSETTPADAEPQFTKIIIGQDPEQKKAGRFFYGCVEATQL